MLLNCDAGENSWESFGLQGDQPVNPTSTWIFIGRTDAEAETPKLWPPDGKDWQQEKKGVTEDEIIGWHHWFNGHEFEQILGDRTGKPGVLQSMGSQRVRNDWVAEQQQFPYVENEGVVVDGVQGLCWLWCSFIHLEIVQGIGQTCGFWNLGLHPTPSWAICPLTRLEQVTQPFLPLFPHLCNGIVFSSLHR